MRKAATSLWEELAAPAQVAELARLARRRRWGLSLALTGWLHLLAFSLCCFLTVVVDYHEPAPYLSIWVGELLGVALIFRLCGGPRPADEPVLPLERFIVRTWVAYFLLAFNLCTMNALRGHRMFEFFPAMASLASFGFLAMTFVVSRRFFAAVLVMFASGLLMATFFLYDFLVFALAWWLVLNGIGLWLRWAVPEGEGEGVAIPSCHRPHAVARSAAEIAARDSAEEAADSWSSPVPY